MRWVLMIVFAIAVMGCSEVIEETTTTTSEEATTTSINPVFRPTTTSTTEQPWSMMADVIVVGDSFAGAGVVQALEEQGRFVIWIAETGYMGGQAAASGVSSMDEQDGVSRMASRDVWPYSGLVDAYRSTRFEPDERYGLPYYGRDNPRSNFSAFGPTPREVRDYLDGIIETEPMEFDVARVIQDDGQVIGIINHDGNTIMGAVVDATEFQDLYPLVDGLEWEVASCVQNTTWTAVRNEFSTVYPPEDAIVAARELLGSEIVDGWVEGFSSTVTVDGTDFTTWGEFQNRPWSVLKEWGYRLVADGYSHVNNNATDSKMTTAVIIDPEAREQGLLLAKERVYMWLWYQRWVLGVEGYGIATDLGYDGVDQYLWSDLIPDDIEQHFAPMPYVREGRTLSNPMMTWEDILIRDEDTEPGDNEFVWGYMADSHGCGAGEQSSSYGHFVVQSDIWESGVEGFWPGMARGSRVDAVVASSVRMQPSEYIGGFMVGNLIHESLS